MIFFGKTDENQSSLPPVLTSREVNVSARCHTFLDSKGPHYFYKQRISGSMGILDLNSDRILGLGVANEDLARLSGLAASLSADLGE